MRTVGPAALLRLCLAAWCAQPLLAADEQAALFHRGLGAHLLSHCLREDLWACVALQLHAQHFPAAARSDDVSAHLEVDAVLLRAAVQYLSSSNTTDTGRGHDDKLLLPLMVAILMKTLGLIPLALGNLTFLGLNSVIASKVSLGLVALLLLKKWLNSDGSLLRQHTFGDLLESAGLALPQFHQPALALGPNLPQYHQPALGLGPTLPPYHQQLPVSLHPQENEAAPAIGRRRKIVLRRRNGRHLGAPTAAADVTGAAAHGGGTTVPHVDTQRALNTVWNLNATVDRNLTDNVPPAYG
ncbi:uncharacterized protein LOC126354313 [Schistocerca gregaria]|uniref:uncharacterized protein LOC126354313 n=1 Tax=Schistocerca gregaria TaxID=7010 RepID=UPI00211EDF86|nr:uncharacterized protein LOC126354313 [Schistocerca gregaria]